MYKQRQFSRRIGKLLSEWIAWSLKWSESVRSGFYYKLLAQGTIEDTEPDVSFLAFYVEAFRELSTCRVNGMGLGSIPFTAITEYCKIYSIFGDDLEEFIQIIRIMDDEFLRLQDGNKKHSDKNNNNKA